MTELRRARDGRQARFGLWPQQPTHALDLLAGVREGSASDAGALEDADLGVNEMRTKQAHPVPNRSREKSQKWRPRGDSNTRPTV